MKSLILSVLALPLLAGCLNDYEHYVKAVEAQAKWRATADIARADAFKEAVTSSDPVVAAVAANGLGITEALRTQGKAAGYGDAPIQAPKSWSDHLGTVTGFLLGAGNIAAQFNATNKGAAVAIEQIRGNVAMQQAQSAERVSIFDRFGATTTALGANVRDVGLGLGQNLENVGKVPHNITTVTNNGDRNNTAVGGTVTTVETTSTNIQCASNGGSGVPATANSSQTTGQQGQTTNSQTTSGLAGQPGGAVNCTNSKGK